MVLPSAPGGVSATALRPARIESIDLLRGIVMIIMALDHVRDYFNRSAYLFDPTDLQHAGPALFLTRWITHFCAPVFMLLSGISAWLYGRKNGPAAASFFLFTRGIWLIVAELSVVTLGWTFNIHYGIFILQVIWAFGISMIVLSWLIKTRRSVQLTIALLLICGHDLLDGIRVSGTGFPAILWSFLHVQQGFSIGPVSFFVGYPILPWIGIITLGYWLGDLYHPDRDPIGRRLMLRRMGWTAIGAFVVIRAFNGYGDPAHWSVQHNFVYTILSFVNVSKYPPSLLYVLMTIGPALLFLSVGERPLNAATRPLAVVGRVPMFYYLIHIYFLHSLAVAAAALAGFPASAMVNLNNWVTANPQLKGYGFGLGVVYAVWIGTIIVLYPLCRWFDRYKRSHASQQKWLSYI
ncbi:MAG TPA: heparan-alpha-glucosaminide N-acetyltransferase domain-containing protein [Puia sp.]|nr:heparan-alpha-glucosaminide N-acetyltransferase domain-containing protein [Puia sp.]